MDSTMPENLRYGGLVPNAHPIYILAMLLAGLLILFLRRENAIYPFVLAGMIIPFGQAVTVLGVHFQMLRFLVLFGIVRFLFGRRRKAETPTELHGLHPIDKAVIGLAGVTLVATIFLFQNMGATIAALGEAYNTFGIYFVLRYLIKNDDDALRSVKALVLVSVVAAIVMIMEQMSHINVFGYLGGENLHPLIREGRLRSQGFFGHSINAGCYGATLFPLCIWLWLKGRLAKPYAMVGAFCSVVMVFTSASSTPLMGLAGALLAFGFWPLRGQMRWVRRGLVVTTAFLHMIMHGPVWALIAHVDVIGGNSADHRYQLVNQCILHFRDWWLIGTNDNNSWGWDMWDTADTFVQTAYRAGLVGLILFVALFSRSFRAIGNARAAHSSDKRKQFELWTLGCVVFGQLMIFVGMDYFDQTILVWYLLLCMVIAVTGEYGLVPAASLASRAIPLKSASDGEVAGTGALVQVPRAPNISLRKLRL